MEKFTSYKPPILLNLNSFIVYVSLFSLKWGFIDNKGHFIMDFQFDDVGREGAFSKKEILYKEKVMFGEERTDYYTVNKDGQWGIMNSDLEVVMPADGQNYVSYRGRKIYIKNGWVTSIRRIKVKKE